MKAYKSLLEDGHSGMSISLTKQILNKLIDGTPLTPIEDTEENWGYIGDKVDHYESQRVRTYQCRRMASLFKYIYPNGEIKYSDIERYHCVNIHNPKNTYQSGLCRHILDEMYPIKMPYSPADEYYVFRCEKLLTDPKNGDFDTIGIIELKHPKGSWWGSTPKLIRRYFKEGDTESQPWIEIDHKEYYERRVKANKANKRRTKANEK